MSFYLPFVQVGCEIQITSFEIRGARGVHDTFASSQPGVHILNAADQWQL